MQVNRYGCKDTNIGYNVDREVHGRLHCTCGITGFLSVHCHLYGLLAGYVEPRQS